MKLASCVLLAFGVAANAMANVAPVVSNVQAAQQPFPSELVQVTYDVYDADNDAMTVSLQISADGGATWTVPVATVSGDVGSGIQSGVYKQIIWNAGVDHPGHTGTQYKAKVIANDNYVPAGMILVPAGSYSMGATYQTSAQPVHTVNVPAFYMDIYEVTNAQYKAFCDATSRAYPPDPNFSGMPNYFTNPTYANYPVVELNWYDAKAYCEWRGSGYRLPSEAEWERAAKGNTDNRQWPWGDTWVAANANVGGGNADGYPKTSPVGSFPSGISPAGCYDMAGNVWEYCEDDWHSSYNGAPIDGSAWIDTPRAADRVNRGGSWYYAGANSRCAYRTQAGTGDDRGFRCARTP